MATTTTITPTLTEAGREAAFNASLTGIAVEITKISFGGGIYAPSGSETALTDQYAIVAIAGGSSISSTQIRITAVWADAELTEDITEIGIWAGDVLFAVWSTEAGTSIASKTPGTDFVLFCDMVFDQVPADSIEVVIDPESSAVLSALAAHETDPDAHEQYQRIDNLAQAAGPLVWCGTAGGTADALLLTLPDSSTLTSYDAGQAFSFIAASNNDGAMTVNVAGLGVVAVTKAGTNVMVADDIIAGALYELVYDGTQFQVRSCLAAGRTFETYTYTATAGQTSFALSYTADLLQVVIDGKTQPPTAFTANDGATVTLGTALTAGQIVHFIVWNVFQVADTYTKAKADATFAPLVDPTFTKTITVTGAATLQSTLAVAGASTLTGAVAAGSTLAVTGATTLKSTLAVTGASTLTGSVTASSTLAVTGATTLKSTLAVTGASTLTGAVTASSTLAVTGATTLASTLAVTGASTLTGLVTLAGGATTSAAATETIPGPNTQASSNLYSAKLRMAGSSGNAETLIALQGYSYTTASFAAGISGTRSFGAVGAHGQVTSGHSSLAIMASASDGAAYQQLGRLDFYTSEDTSSTSSAGEFRVYTTPSGAVLPTLAATFGSDSSLKVAGALTATGAATLSSTLAVTGDATFGGDVILTGTNDLQVPYRIGVNRSGGVPYMTFSRTDYPDGTLPTADTQTMLIQCKTGSATTDLNGGRTIGQLSINYTTSGGGTTLVSARNSAGTSTAYMSLGGDAGTVGLTGATTVTGTLTVSGAATFADAITAAGQVTRTGSGPLSFLANRTNSASNSFYGAQTTAGTIYFGNTDGATFVVNSAASASSGWFSVNATGTTVAGTLEVAGAATMDTTLAVTGAMTAASTLAVTGAVTAASTLTVTGATALKSTLAVTGASTLTGAVTASSTLAVTGATTLKSTLALTGAATLSSTLAVSGTATFAGAVSVGGSATIASSIELGSQSGTANTPFIDFHAGATVTDYDVRLLVSGGTGTAGAGTLNVTAAATIFSGAVEAVGNVSSGSGASFLQTDGNVYGSTWGGYLSTWLGARLPTGSMSSAGYWRCLNTGFMIQWGTVSSLAAETATSITLTTTFPNAIFGGFANSVYNARISGGTNSCYFYPLTTSTATIVSDGTAGVTAPVFWIAIGY